MWANDAPIVGGDHLRQFLPDGRKGGIDSSWPSRQDFSKSGGVIHSNAIDYP